MLITLKFHINYHVELGKRSFVSHWHSRQYVDQDFTLNKNVAILY